MNGRNAQVYHHYNSHKIIKSIITRDKSKLDYTMKPTNKSKSNDRISFQNFFKSKNEKIVSNENSARNQARSHSPSEQNLKIYTKRNMAILKRVINSKNLVTDAYKYASSKDQLKNPARRRNIAKYRVEIQGSQTESHSRSKCISIGFNVLNNIST